MLTADERDALIHKHLGYARNLVEAIHDDLPPWVGLDELLAAGHQGLTEAAGRYDPARGARFTTFAYYRIRGAVFDHIRRALARDPARRARVAAQAAVDDLLEASLGAPVRPPQDPAAAAAAALAGVLEDAAAAFALGEVAAAVASSGAQDPENATALGESIGQLKGAVGLLAQRERTMVEGVYFEGLTIEQAGASMGLSKSWASRLHARALAQLREALRAREDHL